MLIKVMAHSSLVQVRGDTNQGWEIKTSLVVASATTVTNLIFNSNTS